MPKAPALPIPFAPVLFGSGAAWILALSALVNLLFLTGPLFMMQVYDRVLTSGSTATLGGLIVILFLLYAAFGVFDALRSQIAAFRAEEFAEAHEQAAFAASIEAISSDMPDTRVQAPEDVETVRSFLNTPGFTALYDLPSIPLYFIAVLLLHPLLGVMAILAGALLAVLALINERMGRAEAGTTQQGLTASGRILFGARREALSLKANGMIGAAARAWSGSLTRARQIGLKGQRTSAAFTSLTKTLRLAIQSLVLAAGAWLVLRGEMSAGAIIAASVVFARALAPIEQVLSGWRQMLRAKDALQRITAWSSQRRDAPGFALPLPTRTFEASGVSGGPPSLRADLVQGVHFALKAGDVLAILGPSGAGKTSLALIASGVWPHRTGTLKLDGADLAQWPEDALRQTFGYLGQSVDFTEGTVAEIISRFAAPPPEAGVIAAAKQAGVHTLILSLPGGYATRIGPGGVQLSGGQRQRLGLARALYGNPFVVLLDEPAAHLDTAGIAALSEAIRARAASGRITLFTTHNADMLALATHLLALDNGKMTMSGPREAVMKRLAEARREGLPA